MPFVFYLVCYVPKDEAEGEIIELLTTFIKTIYLLFVSRVFRSM